MNCRNWEFRGKIREAETDVRLVRRDFAQLAQTPPRCDACAPRRVHVQDRFSGTARSDCLAWIRASDCDGRCGCDNIAPYASVGTNRATSEVVYVGNVPPGLRAFYSRPMAVHVRRQFESSPVRQFSWAFSEARTGCYNRGLGFTSACLKPVLHRLRQSFP